VETLWNPFRNGSNTLSKTALKIAGKNILLVCVHYPHAGAWVTELHVIIFFLQKCYFAA